LRFKDVVVASFNPMNAHEHSPDSRLKQAEKIVSHPEQYKVCEGCGSIVVMRAVTCPSCHAYRFDATAVRVVAQAKDLALRAASSVLSTDLS
jgi:rubrerythrin